MSKKTYSNEFNGVVNKSRRIARSLIKKVMGVEGFKRKKKYQPDLTWTTPDASYGIDTEVRFNWKATYINFPFDSVHVHQRKLKFMHGSRQVSFWVFRADLEKIMMIGGSELNKYPVVLKNNKYAKQEPFIEVPKDAFIVWEKVNGKWQKQQ